MKFKFYMLLVSITILATVSSLAYWHQLHDPSGGMATAYNVVGDSNTIYVGYVFSGQPWIIKSNDVGKTWDTIYREPFDAPAPFRQYWGMEYPAPGYMYFLYANSEQHVDTATCIKRFDERIGKVVDSVVLDTFGSGARKEYFSMYDSLHGALHSWGQFNATWDGWKTYTKYDCFIEGYFNEDSTEWIAEFPYVMSQMDMIGRDSIFFYGARYNDYLKDPEGYQYHYFLMMIDSASSDYEIKQLTDGTNIKISNDSIHKMTRSAEDRHFRRMNCCYINDSTWIYAARGTRTGYGQCETLEIYKTTNGGKYFYQVCNMDINAYGLSRIDFLNEDFGVAVGNKCTLISTDGGETWTVDNERYTYEWEIFDPNQYQAGAHISFVEEMVFIGCWNTGVFKYEETFGAAVDDKQSEPASCLVYPNPSVPGEMLNFKLSKFTSGEAFVYDLYGKKVQQVGYFGNSFRLREDIAPGTYLVCLMSGGEVVARESINVK